MSHGDQDTQLYPNTQTDAAVFNERVLKKLQSTFQLDPESNLMIAFPCDYQSRLDARKATAVVCQPPGLQLAKSEFPLDARPETSTNLSICEKFDIPEPTICVYPLSSQLEQILLEHGRISFTDANLDEILAIALQEMKIIWHMDEQPNKYIGVLGSQIMIKIRRNNHDFTEYTSLQYLEEHCPGFPAPRPHGLLTKGQFAFMFMSYIQGVTLSALWPNLTAQQKVDLSNQLDQLFLELRRLERPDNVPLGGPSGEGCKDTRRHIRHCEHLIFSNSDYWRFQYTSVPTGNEVYLEFLQRITLEMQSTKCVFTHGDLNPDNVIVTLSPNGRYMINGIIDWEMSGYYPEDFECTKITNNLTACEKSDWYLYLPYCISPMRFPSRWLADRVWDRQVA